MAKNTPFSVFTAVEKIKEHKAKNQSAGTGASSMPNYTQKATPQPSKPAGSEYAKAATAFATIGKAVMNSAKSTLTAKAKSMNSKKKK